MLVFHKERYCTLLRTIAAVVVCLFIYNDIAFALSPKLSLNRSEFEEEYLARSLLLNERSAAQYIGVNTSPGLQRFDDGVCIRAVRGLLKNVGQLAKIDIDNET